MKIILLRVYLNIIEKAQSKIGLFSISTTISRGVQTESKSENRNPGEKTTGSTTYLAVRNCAHMPAI